MKTSRKKLPIGIENFAELQTEEFYYVDKAYLIRDLLSHWAKVNLFTRPRRFGKSLNMSMLKTFFHPENIIKYGIAFYKKTCMVKIGKI